MNPILVEALRGPHVESWHRGAIAIVDADGAVLSAIGDIERAVFPRSAVKALQALPLVASGAADRLGLTAAELALACASHGGEPGHVATALSMLGKAGFDEACLECGAHWPYEDAAARDLAVLGRTPNALHNNCSGKHAGFLCLACALAPRGADLRRFAQGYVDAGHAVMREVTAALGAATGTDLGNAPRGIDGCSIPAFAIPLRALALGFARLGTGNGLAADYALAARRLRAGVAEAPFMVAGSGRMDTLVMQRLGQRVFMKVGAEGMYCAALPSRGLGVAIKIDDGNNARAAEVAIAAVIEACLPLAGDETALLRGYSEGVLRNRRGIEVGALRASDVLRTSLAQRWSPAN